MSNRDLLHALCKEWERLSESEGEAIKMADWNAVAECQSRKKELQSQMSLEAKKVNANVDDPESGPIIKRLLALEERNQKLLDSQRQAMNEKKQAVARCSHDVRRVRSAYSSRPEPVWNSFL